MSKWCWKSVMIISNFIYQKIAFFSKLILEMYQDNYSNTISAINYLIWWTLSRVMLIIVYAWNCWFMFVSAWRLQSTRESKKAKKQKISHRQPKSALLFFWLLGIKKYQKPKSKKKKIAKRSRAVTSLIRIANYYD